MLRHPPLPVLPVNHAARRNTRHPGPPWWRSRLSTLVRAAPDSDREKQCNGRHKQLDRSCERMPREQEHHGDHEHTQSEPAEPEDRNPVHRRRHALPVRTAPSTKDRCQPEQKGDRDLDEQNDQTDAPPANPSPPEPEDFPARKPSPGNRGTREPGSKRMTNVPPSPAEHDPPGTHQRPAQPLHPRPPTRCPLVSDRASADRPSGQDPVVTGENAAEETGDPLLPQNRLHQGSAPSDRQATRPAPCAPLEPGSQRETREP